MGGDDFNQKLWLWVENAMYICVMGALWVLCSLPVVTAGAATVGIYTVFFRKIGLGKKEMLKPFFSAFRNNFKRATLLWLLFLGAAGILGVDIWYYLVLKGGEGYRLVLGAGLSVLLVLLMGVYLYVFPMVACFENTVKETLLKSARCAYTTWWWTLTGLAVIAGVAAVIWAGIWQAALFSGGIVTFSCTYLMLRVFRRPVAGGFGVEKIDREEMSR